MESLLSKALEYKLKYYLKSYSRDQFRLQGRVVQLSNLDLNGDVLHAIIGLPSTLRIEKAHVGKLEIRLPTLTLAKSEPTVVAISKLDMVIAETDKDEPPVSLSASTVAKSTSYTFADRITDGMTVEIGVVNLIIETKGGRGSSGQEGADWIPPIASITIRNMLLYTTNEHWQVVSLPETRDFFKGKKTIHIFRKLEWESLSIDILPHPDMFAMMDEEEDLHGSSNNPNNNNNNDDGIKRAFFGGERFVDNISGNAYITMYRTDTNVPLGLQVDLNLSEVLCPKLSEPALRALMRFCAGIYICLNRQDMKPTTQLAPDAAAPRSFIQVTVDTIFLRIKEIEYQIELVLQSLKFIKGSRIEEKAVSEMSRLYLGNLFLRDTFSSPPIVLIQPGSPDVQAKVQPIPAFAGDNLWEKIYPLPTPPDDLASYMFRMYSGHSKPSPEPPNIAEQTVICCNPLKVSLQESSCFRIASLLADTKVPEQSLASRGPVENSLKSMKVSLEELELIVVVPKEAQSLPGKLPESEEPLFSGASLLIKGLNIVEDPFFRLKVLQVDRDPACFPLWEGQPVNASQRRYAMSASHVSVALLTQPEVEAWPCVEVSSPRAEVAILNLDDSPLAQIPPPGGTVRLGFSCSDYVSDTSYVQLAFVVHMYAYLAKVSKTLMRVLRGREAVEDPQMGMMGVVKKNAEGSFREGATLKELASMAPGDSGVTVGVDVLRFRLLESSPDCQMAPKTAGKRQKLGVIAQFLGGGISLKTGYRSLGGAAAISSSVLWQDVSLECAETAKHSFWDDKQPMRPVFWKGDKPGSMSGTGGTSSARRKLPFVDLNVVNVIPYDCAEDNSIHTLRVSLKMGGVRLGGGMEFNESLLKRFGVFTEEGEPGDTLVEFLGILRENGVFSTLLGTEDIVDTKPKPVAEEPAAVAEEPAAVAEAGEPLWSTVSVPNDMDLDVQLLDWLFAVEGSGDSGSSPVYAAGLSREEKCWHTTFRMLRISAVGKGDSAGADVAKSPLNSVNVRMEGMQALKPRIAAGEVAADLKSHKSLSRLTAMAPRPEAKSEMDFKTNPNAGLTVEFRMVNSSVAAEGETAEGPAREEWVLKSLVFGVDEAGEVEITKPDMDHLVSVGRAEFAAASRIVAGGFKLIQSHGPPIVTHTTIEQLISIGAKVVNGEEMLKSLTELKSKHDVKHLDDEVVVAQNLCKQLVKDLMKAWVRDPNEKSIPTALKVEDGEASEGLQKANEEAETGESIEVIAANRVALLNAQLEKLRDLISKSSIQ